MEKSEEGDYGVSMSCERIWGRTDQVSGIRGERLWPKHFMQKVRFREVRRM